MHVAIASFCVTVCSCKMEGWCKSIVVFYSSCLLFRKLVPIYCLYQYLVIALYDLHFKGITKILPINAYLEERGRRGEEKEEGEGGKREGGRRKRGRVKEGGRVVRRSIGYQVIPRFFL